MPKVQIDLPNDVYLKLKVEAKNKYQSLRAFITYHLVQYVKNPNSTIDISSLPEGTTIKTKTKSVGKPKTRNLIKEALDGQGIFDTALRIHRGG